MAEITACCIEPSGRAHMTGRKLGGQEAWERGVQTDDLSNPSLN